MVDEKGVLVRADKLSELMSWKQSLEERRGSLDFLQKKYQTWEEDALLKADVMLVEWADGEDVDETVLEDYRQIRRHMNSVLTSLSEKRQAVHAASMRVDQLVDELEALS